MHCGTVECGTCHRLVPTCAEVTFGFHMNVTRIHEDPRVTLPYSETRWTDIDARARKVDAQLSAWDVRLTMGGEPTFVSIDDMDGAEWNTAALGERKRELAGELWLRLREQFARGGLLHEGQGKWYPGEPLPRWALTCLWRRTANRCRKNPDLLAGDRIDPSIGPAQAQRFATRLAARLGLHADYVIPAYEDVWQVAQ